MKSNQIVIWMVFCLGFFAIIMPADDRQMLNEEEIKTYQQKKLLREFKQFVIIGDLLGIENALKAGIDLYMMFFDEDILVRIAENDKILKLICELYPNMQDSTWKYFITFAINRKDHLSLKMILQYYRRICDLGTSNSICCGHFLNIIEKALDNEDVVSVAMLMNVESFDIRGLLYIQKNLRTLLDCYEPSLLKFHCRKFLDKNPQLEKLLAVIIDLVKVSSDSSLSLFFTTNLKKMNEDMKELNDEIFTQDWFNIANGKYSSDMITRDHNVQFLLEEGISIPDGLSKEQTDELDFIIESINSSRIINNNLYDAIIYPGISRGMQNPVEELVYKLLNYSTASQVYEQRQMMIRSLFQAGVDDNVNDVKKILNQGLTLNQIKNSKKFTLDQIAWINNIIEQVSIDQEAKLIEENLKKEIGSNEFADGFIEAVLNNNINDVKRILDQQNFPDRAEKLEKTINVILMQYIVNKQHAHILYQLLKHDFILKSYNFFSQNPLLCRKQRQWMDEIFKQVNNEKKLKILQEQIDQENKIIQKNLKEEVSSIKSAIENNKTLLAKKIETEDPELVHSLITDFKDQNRYLDRKLEENIRNATQQIEDNQQKLIKETNNVVLNSVII